MNSYYSTPPVVKNLIIINALFFLATEFLPGAIGDGMIKNLALFYWESPFFKPHQLVTHMFMHANFIHLFTNMFALWMFGRVMEYDLGSKRFLTFYFICGIGAALLQLGTVWIEMASLKSTLAENPFDMTTATAIDRILRTPTVGASGAIFGILLGFGLMHPNSRIMLLFPPIPMKAKYFVIIYGLFELSLGISGKMTNIAHFAHVGGMLWGFLLLRYWKLKGKIYY